MITQILDHFDQAKERLIWQWQNKRNVGLLLKVASKQIQGLEDTLWDILNLNADTANGVNLDVVGRLVGEERAARNDTDFRKGIKVRIIVNRSYGKPVNLRTVALALFGTGNVAMLWQPPHSVQVEVKQSTFALPEIEKALLESAADAVTRVDLHFFDAVNVNMWADDDSFSADGADGFSEDDSFDSASGGEIAADI